MKSVWYCMDCETRIKREELEAHENDGHHVRGQLRPDRLLGNDPWNMTVEGSPDGDREIDAPDGDVSPDEEVID